MSEKKEFAILPKGSYVSIMGCRITLAEDAKVEGNQSNIDYILKDQENFNNGIGVVSGYPTSKLAAGALSAMQVSASVGNVVGVGDAIYVGDNIPVDWRLADSQTTNMTMNREKWRTDMIDRLLSYPNIKSINDAIAQCQKIEKFVFNQGPLSESDRKDSDTCTVHTPDQSNTFISNELEVKAVERAGIALQAASSLEICSCKHRNPPESNQD